MPTLPTASLTLNSSAGAFAGATGYCVVMAPVAQSADSTPRVFSSTQDILNQYLYNSGADYAALHFAKTRKPIIFVGLPITTAGAVVMTNNAGVTGTSPITVTAASTGIMEQVSGIVTVKTGTNVGTDQIILSLSCDNGVSTQSVRLGSASTYTIPNLGIVLNFGPGTLNAGDVFTFQTSAPMWGSTAITLARTNLAAQQNLARSWLVVGDVPNSTFAGYVLTEVNNYETANQRFTYARVQVSDRAPLPVKSVTNFRANLASGQTITVAAAGHTITRSAGSFITDGFVVGQGITVAGTVSNNGFFGVTTAVSATVLTFAAGGVNEGPLSTGVTITGSEVLNYAAAGFTITRSGNASASWITEGFAVGQAVSIVGSASNNVTGLVLTGVSATVLTFGSGIVNEGPSSAAGVTVIQSLTMGAWIAAQASAFAAIDAAKRIDLGAGRDMIASPITGWVFRRPCQWDVSLREYQHDVHIPSYRKADGPLYGVLTDVNGNTVEFDERVNGGGLAGRFTCLRSYANGPLGAFVAISLTRDTEGALTSRTHNMSVVGLAETIVQAVTENMIGQVLILNQDGTAQSGSLQVLQQMVNKQLQVNLLQQSFPGIPSEGPRASSATWVAATTDVLNVVGATLHGTLTLNLNGTVENVATVVVLKTAGN